MLIRLGLNAAVHAAAGVAVAGLAVVAAEGWRRAYRSGDVPRMDRDRERGWASNVETDDQPLEDEPPADATPPPGPRDAGPGGATGGDTEPGTR